MIERMVQLTVLVGCLAGCSVNMALQGRPEPDLGVARAGTNREQLLKILGEPAAAYQGPQGGAEVFRVKLGLPGDTHRALAWAGLDVLTLGLWELVGSMVEKNQGSSVQLAVGYDAEGTVAHVFSSRY